MCFITLIAVFCPVFNIIEKKLYNMDQDFQVFIPNSLEINNWLSRIKYGDYVRYSRLANITLWQDKGTNWNT